MCARVCVCVYRIMMYSFVILDSAVRHGSIPSKQRQWRPIVRPDGCPPSHFQVVDTEGLEERILFENSRCPFSRSGR